jgi:hypothetical protein
MCQHHKFQPANVGCVAGQLLSIFKILEANSPQMAYAIQRGMPDRHSGIGKSKPSKYATVGRSNSGPMYSYMA